MDQAPYPVIAEVLDHCDYVAVNRWWVGGRLARRGGGGAAGQYHPIIIIRGRFNCVERLQNIGKIVVWVLVSRLGQVARSHLGDPAA